MSQRISPRELPELMDGDCSYEDYRDCLRSLEQVNRWLQGYRPTLTWLKRLPRGCRVPMHIVDVGSGGGGLLRQIAGWARRRVICVKLTGIDLNPYAARVAEESTSKALEITWVTGDALKYCSEWPADIVVNSLMAHHLEDEEVIHLLRWMEATARGRMVHQRSGAVGAELPDVWVDRGGCRVASLCAARWASVVS